MMEIHEPFLPTDDEQKLAAALLATAKGIATKGEVEPLAILIDPSGNQAFLPVGRLGDWNDHRDRERGAMALRAVVKAAKPEVVAFISDAWMTTFKDPDAIKAAGLDPRDYHDWPPETQRKFGMVRREALFVSIETKQRAFMVTQFYRRAGIRDRPIWEETVMSAGPMEGRLTGFLRGD